MKDELDINNVIKFFESQAEKENDLLASCIADWLKELLEYRKNNLKN